MADFAKFSRLVHARYEELSKHELFVTVGDKDWLWSNYLAAFPEGTNPIFRERTEHDCSCCRNFIKNIGNVVAIIDGELHSVWEVEGAEYPYDEVATSMSALVHAHPITSLFRTKERQYSSEFNFEAVENGDPIKWNHFHAVIKNRHHTTAPATVVGNYKTTVDVFTRGLLELKPEAFSTAIELIEANNLYRGKEFLSALKAFQKLQQDFNQLVYPESKMVFCWSHANDPATRFRNTAMGTFIQDLSEGMSLDKAVASFEAKVAPVNYKRPTALITKGMVDQAMKTIQELNLEPALERRFAKLSDISVNNVLWVDGEAQQQMKGGVADLLLDAIATKPVTTNQLQEIFIDEFMNNIVPQTKTMDLMLENNQLSKFVSLTAPVHEDTARLFKWNNDFAWSYDGNITDSIKEKVKRAGGNTNAALRFSLAWFNGDDLDIHVYDPRGTHIFYGNKLGYLDVDMNAGGPRNSTDPVENVSWTKPDDGTYTIRVNQFSKRSSSDVGFVIEIENNGSILQYSYDKAVTGTVEVGTVTVHRGRIVELKLSKDMKLGNAVQEKWNIKTQEFIKVNTLMFSPNYWDDNSVGNKHYFFMLEGCINPDPTRGIYNEFLSNELDKHRKVFEVLGNKTKCEPSLEQLSGVGFSSTQHDSLTVRVTLNNNRTSLYKINF